MAKNDKPKYQPFPDLPPDEFEALKADIEERGLQYPILVWRGYDACDRKRSPAEVDHVSTLPILPAELFQLGNFTSCLQPSPCGGHLHCDCLRATSLCSGRLILEGA